MVIGVGARRGVTGDDFNARRLLLPYALGLVALCLVVQIAITASGNRVGIGALILTGVLGAYYVAFLLTRHQALRRIRFAALVAHAVTYVVVNGSFQLHAAILVLSNSDEPRGNQDIPMDPGWFGVTVAMAGFWAIGFTIHAIASIAQRGYER